MGSLKFLQIWKSQPEDIDKNRKMISNLKEERLKRRGNEKREVVGRARDQSRSEFCCHILSKAYYEEGTEVRFG